MKKVFVISLLAVLVACSASFSKSSKRISYPSNLKTFEDTLLFLYTQPTDQWPAPFIDSGVAWTELGIIPESPLKADLEKLKDKIDLGRMLFFDPRLSGSKQISCATCHVPDISWTDGREKSAGHDGQLNKRNAPTILNTWFYKHLFWDGRSHSLEDQAFSPINSEIEMHSSMPDALRTIRGVKGYAEAFEKAFGRPEISPETLTEALAVFQRTLVSRKAAFDRFLGGDTAALSHSALRGLHLFRTKARCMNCHNGPMLTDDSFHNIGLSDYGREHEDLGRYNVTHKDEDVGKFRTPSLRDVMRTRPWMHNGLFDDMEEIIILYNAGMPQPKPKPEQEKDPLNPKTDPLIKKLNLTKQERADLLAFLESITAPPTKVRPPKLPVRNL
ncbi:MAG TPA: cytochrome c peroxidase [Flavisolibacter sp.]|nr:cytochrome c peroxidase [Flavisolibacter sp.]